MLARTHAALIALAVSACTSHEARPSTPELPRADLKVAVASVQLVQDCSDPPEAEAAAVEPAAPGEVERKASAGWVQPCTQSTMQLSLTNDGSIPGKLQIKTIRLLDAATRRELGTLVGRKPSVWSGTGGAYKPWNETVENGGVALKVAYRLADPDWSQVQARLDPGTNLYGRPYMLELEVTVDGAAQTVRSPEFVRQELDVVET